MTTTRRFAPWFLETAIARQRLRCGVLSTLVAALASACGEAAPASDDRAHGDLVIESAFESPGPTLGDNALALEVRDLEGEPVVGAVVTVTPWMPAHGHGSPSRPVVVEAGAGRYRASGVVLHMPGTWQLTLRAVVGARAGERLMRFELGE